MSDVLQNVKQLSDNYFNEIKNCRQYLHQHPELSFEEYKTSEYICNQLSSYNIIFQKGIAKTGVVGLIEGRNPSKKTIALRADMDALPITEKNNVAYKSLNDGVMHACGHDVHTACLLGAAKILNECRNEFEGSVKLIFQPSEEKYPGGASVMIKENVLENPKVESIIGQHVFTPFEVGKVAFCFGKMMASTDEIYITIKGKGGHGAYPHETKDPVAMAAQIIVSLQQVVSRMISPMQPCVLSFGKVVANGATNIIPDEVYLEGTIRALDEHVRSQALEAIIKITKNIADAFGGTANVKIIDGYPVLSNDPHLTRRAFDRAIEYLGRENVLETTARMGAEDFSFYSQLIPACFYRLGTGNPSKGITSFMHTPTFDIDEDAMRTGMGLMAWQAIGELISN